MNFINFEILGGSYNNFPLFKAKDAVKFIASVKWEEIPFKPIIGITIKNDMGNVVWCMNSAITLSSMSKIEGVSIYRYSFICQMPDLRAGIYTADFNYAEGELNDCKMIRSVERAGAFGILASHEYLPEGNIFVDDVDLVSELLE